MKKYPWVRFDGCVMMVMVVCVVKMRMALETGCIRLPVSYHDVFVWETKIRNFLDFPFKGSFRARESTGESENDLRKNDKHQRKFSLSFSFDVNRP